MLIKDKSLVTQAELLRLDTVKKEADRLREQIRDRVLDGALVEPGKLCVRVETCRKRSLSHEALRRLMGHHAELIINALPMVTSHKMLIRSNESNLSGDEPKAVFDPSVNVKSGTIDKSPRIPLSEVVNILSTALKSKTSESDQTSTVDDSASADDTGQKRTVYRPAAKFDDFTYSELEYGEHDALYFDRAG